jgi:hypothetical protein
MAGRDENTYGFRKDDADALVNMIGMGEAETTGRRLGGSQFAALIMTPIGGIPPRVGTLLGSAICDTYTISSGNELIPTGSTIEVLNMTATPVEGDAYGQAKRISGRWVIDVEECEVDEPSSSTAVP